MDQRRADTTHGRALGNTQQAGKCAVLHMALAAINFIIIGGSSIYTADFLLLPGRVTAGSLRANAIFLLYSLPSEDTRVSAPVSRHLHHHYLCLFGRAALFHSSTVSLENSGYGG